MAFFVFGFATTLKADTMIGSWNLTISPSPSYNKTILDVSATGNISTGFTIPARGTNTSISLTSFNIGVSGNNGSPPDAWTITNGSTFLIPTIGKMTNQITLQSRKIDSVLFHSFNGVSFISLKTSEASLNVATNDTVAYIFNPEPASFEIDLNFSNFNPGIYNSIGSNVQYFMTIIPEPSSLSLLLAGGVVLMAGRRRK